MEQPEPRISAKAVPEAERTLFLPNKVGNLFISFEQRVYAAADALMEGYNGGLWDFFDLSNGGFYMAPESPKSFDVRVDGNGFHGEMSNDAAGIVACLFALNGMAWAHSDEKIVDLYYQLKEFACDHPEAAAILEAID